ncbi:MAG TPA: ABC transporter permease [Terriglobales bacterium]|jgi:peptide/nickel transport system permease protein|nr:ABC transporter permease [Terriglobales bacterium]
MLWRISRRLLAIAAIVVLGGLTSATLVRFAPGFATDEQQLDPRLSAESLQALHQSHESEKKVFLFYAAYLNRAWHGDLGISRSLNRPVSSLLRDRFPVTLRLVAMGLALGWLIALSFALTSALARVTAYRFFAIALSGALLCIPAAVLALLSVVLNTPGYLAIALLVFPKVFTYSRSLLERAYSSPHIVTARAKGLGRLRILCWHVFPVVAPSLVALAGVSVSMAIGAAIPIEALCGVAGVGDLAWQAALARDLPLLVNITILVTVATLLSNSGADVVGHALRAQES